MYQALLIVLREGLEAFLIVAIIFAYLRKTNQSFLLPAVWWGIASSVLLSILLGYFLWLTQGIHEPLVESVFGLFTIILIASLVIHMWRLGPRLKQEMESGLQKAAGHVDSGRSFWGVFAFSTLMISREGMETALLLFQIHEPQIILGACLGALAAGLTAIFWQQFSYLINLKHFFRITTIFILLFGFQVVLHSFHELTETGLLPNSEQLHVATEIFSPDSIFSKWYGFVTLVGCTLALLGTWVLERFQKPKIQAAS